MAERGALLEELERLGVDMDSLVRSAEETLKERLYAQRCLRDPWAFFSRVICTPEQRPLVGAIHRQGLDFINRPSLRKLILWPRGHLKTSLFTQGETLRRAILAPESRTLLSTAIEPNAKTFLRGIKGHLENPELVRLYGALLPAPSDKKFKNTETELTLLTRKVKKPQATFTTTSMESTKTSQHYDLIVHDDLVTRDNIGSVEMLDKTVQYYRDCLPLLDPKRELWVIGTRWHPLDLYGVLMDGATDDRCAETLYRVHAPSCKCKFDVSIRMVKEDGEYIYPEVFDEAHMELLREADGLDRFSEACQYYNNPADPSACWFRQADIDASLVEPSVIEELDKQRRLTWFASIDPAESLDSRACKTAAVCAGLDLDTGTLYVDWALGRRVETSGLLDMCIETHRRYKPAKFGMELNTRKALGYSLKQRMAETGTFFNVEELKPSTKGGGKGYQKELRIKRLLPLFEHKRIKINSSLKDLLDELYTIPSSRSRDLTDALAYILDLIPEQAGIGRARDSVRLPSRVIGWKSIGY